MKFSVFEYVAFGDEFEYFIALQTFPFSGLTLGQHEHHGKARSPRPTSFRFSVPQPDRRE